MAPPTIAAQYALCYDPHNTELSGKIDEAVDGITTIHQCLDALLADIGPVVSTNALRVYRAHLTMATSVLPHALESDGLIGSPGPVHENLRCSEANRPIARIVLML